MRLCARVRLRPHQLLPANHGAPAFLVDTGLLSYWSLSKPPLTDALLLADATFSSLCIKHCICVSVCAHVSLTLQLLTVSLEELEK